MLNVTFALYFLSLAGAFYVLHYGLTRHLRWAAATIAAMSAASAAHAATSFVGDAGRAGGDERYALFISALTLSCAYFLWQEVGERRKMDQVNRVLDHDTADVAVKNDLLNIPVCGPSSAAELVQLPRSVTSIDTPLGPRSVLEDRRMSPRHSVSIAATVVSLDGVFGPFDATIGNLSEEGAMVIVPAMVSVDTFLEVDSDDWLLFGSVRYCVPCGLRDGLFLVGLQLRHKLSHATLAQILEG